jgi:hypothetical protein
MLLFQRVAPDIVRPNDRKGPLLLGFSLQVVAAFAIDCLSLFREQTFAEQILEQTEGN